MQGVDPCHCQGGRGGGGGGVVCEQCAERKKMGIFSQSFSNFDVLLRCQVVKAYDSGLSG